MDENYVKIYLIFMVTYGVITIISFIGSIILIFSTFKSIRKYRAYTRNLKRQNKYHEWVAQYKGLVTFEKISNYLYFLFALALLVFWGTMEEIFQTSKVIVLITGIMVFLFWPYCFISQLVNSRLYKKIPTDSE
jgi:preprotein translocase subunit SecE